MFIGTEAPQEFSFGVYWRMVWLTKAKTLVVINQKIEEQNVRNSH
jgi:protein tyrosine phosphatase